MDGGLDVCADGRWWNDAASDDLRLWRLRREASSRGCGSTRSTQRPVICRYRWFGEPGPSTSIDIAIKNIVDEGRAMLCQQLEPMTPSLRAGFVVCRCSRMNVLRRSLEQEIPDC